MPGGVGFGRREEVDLEALRRPVRSITRFLGPEDGLKAATSAVEGEPARFIESRPMGAAWLLRRLWERLKIDRDLQKVAARQGVKLPAWVEGAIFGMVANRALDPCATHARPDWLETSVAAAGVPTDTCDEALYRAMDLLLGAEEELQRAAFFSTADLFDLEVDLLVPTPQVVNDPPLRLQGHPKDHRPDRAQVVVGLPVTRQGIPVRCWTWPGNTNDYVLVRNPAQVARDREERERTLGRIETATRRSPTRGPRTPRRCVRCSPIRRWGGT